MRSARLMGVDYARSVTLPVRDMRRDGAVVFLVTVYGWTSRDVCVIPGGSDPFVAAVRRLGLDPDRFQVVMWDAMYLSE